MTKTIEKIALTANAPGTQRHLLVHRYGKKGARPKAYLQASLHADELPGMMALQHLIPMLDAASARGEIKGEIVLLPVANPIGLSQNLSGYHLGRHEAGGGGNFNRNWPDLYDGLLQRVAGKLGPDATTNVATVRAAMHQALDDLKPVNEFGALRAALSRMACDADIVLDLHCDNESLMHLFLTPAHWPDPGRELAGDLGSHANLLAADSGGRSFDETFSMPWVKLAQAVGAATPVPIACFAVTVEFRGQADVFDELGAIDAASLYRFLQRRGLVAGDPGPLKAPPREGTDLEAADILRAPKAGMLAYKAPLGAWLKKGDLVAELIDPLAEDPKAARTPIYATTDGQLLSRVLHKLVRPGDSLGKLVGTVVLESRKGYLLED